MARLARVTIPNLPYHVTQRGNRRQQTFFCDGDYQLYLDLLAQWCLFYAVPGSSSGVSHEIIFLSSLLEYFSIRP